MSIVGDFTTDFMRDRKLSITVLASSLGYKSPTSLVRIIQGSANMKSVCAFANCLKNAYKLTSSESERLDRVIKTQMLGVDGYEAENEMWAFLRGEKDEGAKAAITDDASTNSGKTVFERYKDCRDIVITVLNCQYVNIFKDLKRLLTERGASVKHYNHCDRDTARTIRAINSTMPVLYEKNYDGYALYDDGQIAVNRVMGVTRADMLLCGYTRNGVAGYDFIVFDGQNHGYAYSIEPFAGGKLFGVPSELYYPVKKTWFNCGFEDYIRYSTDYSRLEFNRAVYKVKPDIGIDYICPAILLKAFREGSNANKDMPPETVETLTDIYAKRFDNTFTKRKPSYTVLKKNAMRLFAQTGRTTDHFWAMRAFTPSERIDIINNLLEQHRLNPYFHLYFLRDDFDIRDAEIALYEDAGMLVLECDTDYDLKNGHAEVMINHPEFMRLYKRFMLETLTKMYVLPREDTVYILEELAQSCRAMI